MPAEMLVAGNWKMNTTIVEGVQLANALRNAIEPSDGVDVLVCPPAVSVGYVADTLEGSGIQVGAQHMYWERAGAFTGEISPRMLAELCSHVIVGHSERRQHFGETNVSANLRVKAALEHNMAPILCVGETLVENEAGRTGEVVGQQVRAGLEGIPPVDASELVLAYEPVWAIGTGKAATPDDAAKVIEHTIRPALEFLFDRELSQSILVLYGGSVSPQNAGEFFRVEGIDGALVGGASLRADSFAGIVAAAGG